jgi:diadenosine tetraphosphatase ApaH/serine/threonine PP2A family protein phosphatase
MHGGLSPDLNSMEQIRRVMRPTDVCRAPPPSPTHAIDMKRYTPWWAVLIR